MSDEPFSIYDSQQRWAGRRRIPIQFITDRNRRQITFSKRKAGIMKKAFELSTLTGTEVMLLVASETGHVYTFATPKLRPLIKNSAGRDLIQACLKAPSPADTMTSSVVYSNPPSYGSKDAVPSSYSGISSSDQMASQSHAGMISNFNPTQFVSPSDPSRFAGAFSLATAESLASTHTSPAAVMASRAARLHAYDQAITRAAVDKELLPCPGIAKLFHRLAMANGFEIDSGKNGSWRVNSFSDPSSVMSLTVVGQLGEIIIASFFLDSPQTPGTLTLRESFRFIRGENNWLLQEWDGRYLEIHQVFFDLANFLMTGSIQLISHPAFQAEQTRNLITRLSTAQTHWLREEDLIPLSELHG